MRKELLSKLGIIMYVFILLGLLIFLKILVLKTIKRSKYEKLKRTFVERTIKANRGNILDINGNILATSVVKYDIYFDPNTEYLRKMDDSTFSVVTQKLSKKLAEYFPQKTAREYHKLIMNARKKGLRGILLVKNIPYKLLDTVKTFPVFSMGRNRGGLIAEEKTDRILINGSLARRTIGFFNNEGKAFGIENTFGGFLSGVDGKAIVQKISPNQRRTVYEIKKAEDGADVVSTLDIRLQEIVEKSLEKRLIQLDADYGVAILMDVKTGEIRALANLGKIDDSVYFENRNYAVGTTYEPGSVMKLASFIIAFEKSDIPLDSIIDTDEGIWQISKTYKIRDYKKGGFGKISVRRVFEVSSNVGTAKLIWHYFKNNPEDFVQRYSDFGFAKPLDIKLEEVARPIFRTPSDPHWEPKVTMLQMSIGYAISVTPMHIITFYNAIANNGKMLKPLLVKKIISKGKVVKSFEPEVINPAVCSKRTLDKVKILLKGVVENGTGKNFVKSKLVSIAGKSGTAWSYSEKAGGYKTEQGIIHNATFVAYFPAEKPKYTCLVMIHNPRRVATGGASAAGVVVKEIAEKIYAIDYDLHPNQNFIVNLQPDKKTIPQVKNGFKERIKFNLKKFDLPFSDQTNNLWVKVIRQDSVLIFKGLKIRKGFMPDLRGMSIQDAIYIANLLELKIKFTGYGKVVKQSIPPHQRIKPGQIVNLVLK